MAGGGGGGGGGGDLPIVSITTIYSFARSLLSALYACSKSGSSPGGRVRIVL